MRLADFLNCDVGSFEVVCTNAGVERQLAVCSLCDFCRPKMHITECGHTFCHSCVVTISGNEQNPSTALCQFCDWKFVAIMTITLPEQFVLRLKCVCPKCGRVLRIAELRNHISACVEPHRDATIPEHNTSTVERSPSASNHDLDGGQAPPRHVELIGLDSPKSEIDRASNLRCSTLPEQHAVVDMRHSLVETIASQIDVINTADPRDSDRSEDPRVSERSVEPCSPNSERRDAFGRVFSSNVAEAGPPEDPEDSDHREQQRSSVAKPYIETSTVATDEQRLNPADSSLRPNSPFRASHSVRLVCSETRSGYKIYRTPTIYVNDLGFHFSASDASDSLYFWPTSIRASAFGTSPMPNYTIVVSRQDEANAREHVFHSRFTTLKDYWEVRSFFDGPARLHQVLNVCVREIRTN